MHPSQPKPMGQRVLIVRFACALLLHLTVTSGVLAQENLWFQPIERSSQSQSATLKNESSFLNRVLGRTKAPKTDAVSNQRAFWFESNKKSLTESRTNQNGNRSKSGKQEIGPIGDWDAIWFKASTPTSADVSSQTNVGSERRGANSDRTKSASVSAQQKPEASKLSIPTARGKSVELWSQESRPAIRMTTGTRMPIRVAKTPALIETEQPAKQIRATPKTHLTAAPRLKQESERPQANVSAARYTHATATAVAAERYYLNQDASDRSRDSDLLDTESMIGPLGEATSLLGRVGPTNDLFREAEVIHSGPRMDNAMLEWVPASYSWISPVFYHKPLYFEQPNLERYGNGRMRAVQPVLSAAHFFGTIPLVPYKTLTHHPRERLYTLGNMRPGNCVPLQRRVVIGQSTIGEYFLHWQNGSGY